MRTSRFGHAAVIVAGFFLAFVLRSCRAPEPYRDVMSVGEIAAAPRLQVGLMKFYKTASARVGVHGAYSVHGAKGPLDQGTKLEFGDITVSGGKTVIGRESYPDDVVRIVPENDGDLQIGETHYHGELLIFRDGERLILVNEVDLEWYLKGVVGKEMSLSVDEKALRAQVICARTYAMYEVRNQTLRRVKGEKFDLYDDERSQVYGGMERETELACRLVNETRGEFIVWQGRILKAFYSSTCGGHTEPAWKILGEGEEIPPLGGTKCGYCTTSKYFNWTAEFAKADLAKKLFPGDPKARIKSIRITKTLPGGHALEVGLTLENSSKEVLVHATAGFRRKIDTRVIRSTMWESIDDRGDKIVIVGHGWGHGAGMCQVGAYNLAAAGKSGAEIVRYYFPGADVKKLY